MVNVRLAQDWTDGTGTAHSAGDMIEVDAATLAELEATGVVEWAGPTGEPAGSGSAEWAGPTGGSGGGSDWAGPTGGGGGGN